MEDIKQLVDASAKDYGNKSANLIVMRDKCKDKGINVPDICPLSHDQCLTHLNKHYPGWRDKWEKFKSLQGSEKGGLAEGTHEILKELRLGIEQSFVEHPLESEEITEYLSHHFEPGEVLMVRSTGKEDSAELANPGGNESYAGISADIKAVSTACGKVIASYFSEKSLEQRLKAKQVDDPILGEPFMPVLLQKMIGELLVEGKETPEKKVYSGVMYVSKDGKVMIQEAPGHGELVVNSKGPTNSYFILGDGTVHQQINEKPFRMVSYINEAGKAELIMQKNSRELRSSSLSKLVVERLSNIGKEIQAFYGDDRDIEFVYDEHQDKLYIVQARPIPLGESAKHSPRAISPEQIRTVKKSAPHYKGKTIAAAASRADIVYHQDEVIICNTIGDALQMYLDMMDPKIKAVVVARDAPSTSHEAAEFNSVSIPVFYMDKAQKNKIQKALEQGGKQFIFDPQRGLIVDWTNKDGPEGVLKEGFFKSSISAERTLLSESVMSFSMQNIQEAEKLLTGAKKKKGMSYEELLNQLEIIESTTSSTIEKSREALKQVLMDIIDICRVVHERDTQMDKDLKRNILKHAIAYSLDINKLLEKIPLGIESTISTQDQTQLLDLVNGLEALIANPGRKGLYSYSVYNLMQDAALKNRLKKEYPIYADLPEENKKVVEALSQFGKNAANDELKKKWERFVVLVAKSDMDSSEKNLEKLASIIYFIESNELGSVFINNIFSQLAVDAGHFAEAIAEMNKHVEKLKPYADKIFSLEVKAAELEAKAVLWGKKKNHGKLIEEYEKDVAEILKCIDSFGPLHALPLLAKTKVLGEIAKMTEILDGSIKIMKGCQDYLKDDHTAKDEQANLFHKMLVPYHDLMQKMIKNLPEKIPGYRNSDGSKAPWRMAEKIKLKFESFRDQKITRIQLSTSGNFAVNSATISSPADFERQFGLKILYLEDYFTLFHQNIIAAISYIGPELSLPEKEFPAELRLLTKAIKEKIKVVDGGGNLLSALLISAEVKDSIIMLEYNIPLDNHAAKIYVNYDVQNKTVEIKPEIYGNEQGGRMAKAEKLFRIFPKGIDLKIEEEATYNDKQFKLSTVYAVDMKSDKGYIVEVLPALINRACEITFEKNTQNNKGFDWFLHNFRDDAQELKLKAIIYLAQNVSLCLNDMYSIFGYVFNSKRDVREKFLEIVNACEQSFKDNFEKKFETVYKEITGDNQSFENIIKLSRKEGFRDILTLKLFDVGLDYDVDDLERLMKKDENLDFVLNSLVKNNKFNRIKEIVLGRSINQNILSSVLGNIINNPALKDGWYKEDHPIFQCIRIFAKQGAIPGFETLAGVSMDVFDTLVNSYSANDLNCFLSQAEETNETTWERSLIVDLLNQGKLKIRETKYTEQSIKDKFSSVLDPMKKAVNENNIEVIKQLISEGKDINVRKGNKGILDYAVEKQNFEMALKLLDLNVEPFRMHKNPASGRETKNVDIVESVINCVFENKAPTRENAKFLQRLLKRLDERELRQHVADIVIDKKYPLPVIKEVCRIQPDVMNSEKTVYLRKAIFLDNLDLFKFFFDASPNSNYFTESEIFSKREHDLYVGLSESIRYNSESIFTYLIENECKAIVALKHLRDIITRAINTEFPAELLKDLLRHQSPEMLSNYLCIAVEKNRFDIVDLLMELGCDINAVDLECRVPLELAVKEGTYEMVLYLLEKGASYNRDGYCMVTNAEPELYGELLSFALRKKDMYFLNELLDQDKCPINPINLKGMPILSLAVKQNNEMLVKKLLERGADPNFGGDNSAMEYAFKVSNNASKNNFIELLEYYCEKGTADEYARALENSNADLNGRIAKIIDKIAANYRWNKEHPEIIKHATLTKLVDDLVLKNKNNKSISNELELIEKALIVYDALYNEIEAISRREKKNGFSVQKMLAELADRKYLKSSNQLINTLNPKALAIILMNKRARKHFVKGIDLHDDCYLPVIRNKNSDIFKVLLANKIYFEPAQILQSLIDENALDLLLDFIEYAPESIHSLINGESILLYAIRTNQIQAAKLIIEKTDLNINFVNSFNQNSLHLAVKNGDLELIEILLRAGVNPYLRDSELKTPIMLALESKKNLLTAVFKTKTLDNSVLLKKFINTVDQPIIKSITSKYDEAHDVPDISLFAQINASHKIKHTKLEGNQFRYVSHYLSDILKRNHDFLGIDEQDYKKIQKAFGDIETTDNLILGLNSIDEIDEIANTMCDSIEQCNELTIAGGYHSAFESKGVLYRFTKFENKISMKIYNTGDGISFHKSSDDGKHQCLMAYEFEFERQKLTMIIKTILEHRYLSEKEGVDIDSRKVYFDIVGLDTIKGLDNLQIQELRDDEVFDSKKIVNEINGNGIVFYKKKTINSDGSERTSDCYALIFYGTCLVEEQDPKNISYSEYKEGKTTKDEFIQGIKDLHCGALKRAGAFEVDEEYTDRTLTRGQISENSHYKSLQSGLLKDMLPQEKYQNVKLIIRLQSLLDFAIEHEMIGDLNSSEIKMEICNAIEKTAKFMHDNKDELKLVFDSYNMISKFIRNIRDYVDTAQLEEGKSKHLSKQFISKPIKNVLGDLLRNRSADLNQNSLQSRLNTIDTSVPSLNSIEDIIKNISKFEIIDEDMMIQKQRIALMFNAIPINKLLQDEDSRRWLENKENSTAFMQAIQKYIEIYTHNIKDHYTPGDLEFLQKMLILIECVHQRAEELLNLSPNSYMTKKIYDGIKKIRSQNLFIAATSDYNDEKQIEQLLADRNTLEQPSPVDLLKSYLDEDKIQEYLGQALTKAKKISGKADSPINRLESQDTKNLVCNYIALELNNPDFGSSREMSENLTQDVIDQCRYMQVYHQAMKSLYEGIFMQSCTCIEYAPLKLEESKQYGGGFFKLMKNKFFAPHINFNMLYDVEGCSHFMDTLMFPTFRPKANAIQVNTVNDHKNREIQYTRTHKETQFFKTIDYLKSHTDNLAEPELVRLMWVNLFNTESIRFAKKHHPEAIVEFMKFLNDSIKKYIDNGRIDHVLLNLFDLYSFMKMHISDLALNDIEKQKDDINESIKRLIVNINVLENTHFETILEKKRAYSTQSRLHRTVILMLASKINYEVEDYSLFLQSKYFLRLFPASIDLPFLNKMNEAISSKMILRMHQLGKEDLNKIMSKIFPMYEREWKIEGTTIINSSADFKFDVLTGLQTEKSNNIDCIPSNAFEDSQFIRLFPDVDFSTKVTYSNTDNFDEHYFYFEHVGSEVRYQPQNNKIQKKYHIGTNQENVWCENLIDLNNKFDFRILPPMMRSSNTDLWLNLSHPNMILITNKNGIDLKYVYVEKVFKRIENGSITDYTLFSLENKDHPLSRLLDFESAKGILAWHSATASPSYKVELPRYNLSIIGEQHNNDLIFTMAKYPGYRVDLSSANDINGLFNAYIKLVAIDGKAKDIILIPMQQFMLCPEEEKRSKTNVKYTPLILDKNDSDKLDSEYIGSEGFTEFELDNKKLLSSNQDDLLHSIYIYLGSHDYEKSYDALDRYITNGGFLGSPKELRMFNLLLNSIPRNVFDDENPRHDKIKRFDSNDPIFITIKLKLAAQMAKYINSQGVVHISEEDKTRLKMKDWEVHDINGVMSTPSLLSAGKLRETVTYWKSKYDRQLNNIPSNMRLSPVEDTILRNLLNPISLKAELEKNPLPFDVSISVPPQLQDIPESVSKICERLKIDFKLNKNQDLDDIDNELNRQPIFKLRGDFNFNADAVARANEDYEYAVKQEVKRELYHNILLEKFLEVPEGSRKRNIVRLVQDIQGANDILNDEMTALKNGILDFANSNLNKSEFRMEILAKRKNKLTMEDLNRLFIKNNMEDFKNETSLEEDKILDLRSRMYDYFQRKSQAALYQKFLALTSEKIDSKEELKKIIPDIYKWHLQERVYDVNKHPEFLLFEAEEGVLISKKQYQILKALLSTNAHGNFDSQVMQLIMGGGKSKVLLPLLALCKTTGDNLSIIVVPDALLNTNFADLASTAKRLFNQDIYHFNFSRDGDYSVQTLTTKLNELDIVMKKKSFIVMNKTALEDLELKLIELQSYNRSEDAGSIALMKQILKKFREKGDALIDEIHAVHNIRVERNFSLAGFSEKLNREYISVNMQFFDFWRSIRFKETDLLSFIAKSDSSFTADEISKVMVDCIDDLINSNNKLSPLRDLVSKYPGIKKEEWTNFLLATSEPTQFSEIDDALKAPAYLVKEQLSNILPLSLIKNPLEHYGLTKRPKELETIQGALCKPFLSANNPNENSRFSSPLETLNYTVFYSLKYGILPVVLEEFIKRFVKQAQDERELLQRTGKYKSIVDTKAADLFEKISGLNRDILTKDLTESLLSELHAKCSKNRKLVMYCLENLILPEIDVDTLLLRHNSINHASQFRSVQGFSGTILSPYIFDARMKPFNYDFAMGTDGETLHHIIRKNTDVIQLEKTSSKDILNELFKARKENTSAIIDVGGTLKGLSNLAVAHEIVRHVNQDKIKYVLFFNAQDQLTALPVNEAHLTSSSPVIIGSTDPDEIKKKLNVDAHDHYFVYYDQSHTIGVDVKQGAEAHAIVTCGRTLLSQLLQGVMRMRSFAMNQNITLFADQQIKADLGIENLDCIDILNYAFEYQLHNIAKDNVIATQYLLKNVLRNEMILKILDENDLSYFKVFEDILFDKQVLDACRLFSGLKGKRSTENEFRTLQAALITSFCNKTKDIYPDDEFESVYKRIVDDTNYIIKRQLSVCPQKIDSISRNNYGQESVAEKDKDTEKDKDIEKELDTDVSNQMQPSFLIGAFNDSPEISWDELDESIKNNFVDFPDCIECEDESPLFYKLNEYDNGFSFLDNISLSRNQIQSDYSIFEIFGPLKKPVECTLWTINSENQLRATLITSSEYKHIIENDSLPKNSWIESQLGTPIMGIKPATMREHQTTYDDTKAQIAYYNCDLASLLNNESARNWMLSGDFEQKMRLLESRILPLHSERKAQWEFFEKYFKQKHMQRFKKSLKHASPEQLEAQLLEAFTKINMGMMKFLISLEKCPVNIVNGHGMPLLSTAVLSKDEDFVKRLLERGADPNFGGEKSALKFANELSDQPEIQTILAILELATVVKPSATSAKGSQKHMLHIYNIRDNKTSKASDKQKSNKIKKYKPK